MEELGDCVFFSAFKKAVEFPEKNFTLADGAATMGRALSSPAHELPQMGNPMCRANC